MSSPPSRSPSTPQGRLFQAIDAGDLVAAQRACDEGAHPWPERSHLFVHAARQGHLAVMDWLRERGTPTPKHNEMALRTTIALHRWPVVLDLMKRGILPDSKGRETLREHAPYAVLAMLTPALSKAEYEAAVERAFNTVDGPRLDILRCFVPPQVSLTMPLVKALHQKEVSEPLLRAIWQCCDTPATIELLAKGHHYQDLDRLAGLLTMEDRAHLVQAYGTRNLPQAWDRLQTEQRASLLAQRPASPTHRSRSRA